MPSKLNEIFQGDFIQHLFLSAGNMKEFKYDFFLRKFGLNINEEFMDSLSLIDQKWYLYKISSETDTDTTVARSVAPTKNIPGPGVNAISNLAVEEKE